jgi:signal transduction histidine kinase/ActR/RegA family two-component response regulator
MAKPNEWNAATCFYRGVVAAALLLPLFVFVCGGSRALRTTPIFAREGLSQTRASVSDGRMHVFNSHFLTEARGNDLLRGLDDAAIAERNLALHQVALEIRLRYPELCSGTVIDRDDGSPLLASGYSSDRSTGSMDCEYLEELRNVRGAICMVRLVLGRLTGQPGLSVAHGCDDDPENLKGAILVFALSRHFANSDRLLFNDDPVNVPLLVHEVSDRLAGFPSETGAGRTSIQVDEPHATTAQDQLGDLLRVDPVADRNDWLIGYHKLNAYPIYVAVLRLWSSIVSEWRTPIAMYLIFGLPTILALVALSLVGVLRKARYSAMLATLRAELERRELVEDALRRSDKMEAVGRLTGGIAHDFNNHLTVISSNIELLKRRLPADDNGLLRLADGAMQGVQRAATLAHRLLVFSRQRPLEPEPLDAGRLLTDMSELLSRTLGESIAVKISLAAGLWQIRVDANQLESALLHLAVNARDAMPYGGTLTIETANKVLDASNIAAHPDVSTGAFVVIKVAATGVGIPSDSVAKMFGPVFTFEPFDKGSGLGLSMVYGFVRQFGGHLEIVSDTGLGTTLHLYLPRYLCEDALANPTASTDITRVDHAGETILLVEDDEAVRSSTAEALRAMGYQLLEASDAMEAIRLILDRGGIDLLFTDVGLPGGVNGQALADAARSVCPKIGILFTTGYARMPMLWDTVPPGGLYFLAKPFTLEELGAKVREVLDAPAATQMAEATSG